MHRAIDELIRFRMTPNRLDGSANGRKELTSEAGTLAVLPRVRVIKISLRLRAETKSLYLRRSSLARTSPQDLAAEGLRACARRRLANSLRWVAVTGIAFGVSTRLSQISSINSNRSWTLSERACCSTVLMTVLSAGSHQAARLISVAVLATAALAATAGHAACGVARCFGVTSQASRLACPAACGR